MFLSVLILCLTIYIKTNVTPETITSTTTTRSFNITTTTLPVVSGTVLKPATDNLAWTSISYMFQATPYLTVPQQQGANNDSLNKGYVIANGYNAYIQNNSNATMNICQQGTTASGNTLVVYKNNTYWCALNTDVQYGPNLTFPFTNIQLGRVLASIQRNWNNMAVISGIIDPMAPYNTLVSGLYSVDAAMLNITNNKNSASTTTWFYGGLNFPYAYTLKSFVPASS